jgi:hypothetical protein
MPSGVTVKVIPAPSSNCHLYYSTDTPVKLHLSTYTALVGFILVVLRRKDERIYFVWERKLGRRRTRKVELPV